MKQHQPRRVRFAVPAWAGAACLFILSACGGDPSTQQTDEEADAGATAEPRVCDVSIEFSCGDGSCYSPDKLCDGVVDCPNKRDERSCGQGCPSGQVGCGNGECIQLSAACDGVIDCGDGSDERGCAKPMCAGLPSRVPGYQGQVYFTRQQFMQCLNLCGQNDACRNEANCPGIQSFNACIRQESLACSARPGGACRIDFESFQCCSLERCVDDGACVSQMCSFEAAVLKACLPKDYNCVSTAAELCFAS